MLYLTDSGGPTVVLSQTVSSPLAQAAWLSWPQSNNLLCYPGNLLHGVIPGPQCKPLGWPAHIMIPMVCTMSWPALRASSHDSRTSHRLLLIVYLSAQVTANQSSERTRSLPG